MNKANEIDKFASYSIFQIYIIILCNSTSIVERTGCQFSGPSSLLWTSRDALPFSALLPGALSRWKF